MPRVRGLTAAQREVYRIKDWQKRCTAILKVLMSVHDKTQADIGDVIKRSRVAVSGRLRGRTEWSALELVLMADYFRVDDQTRSALLGGKEKCRWEL